MGIYDEADRTQGAEEAVAALLAPAALVQAARAAQAALATATPADATSALAAELAVQRTELVDALAAGLRYEARNGDELTYDAGSYLDAAERLERGLAQREQA